MRITQNWTLEDVTKTLRERQTRIRLALINRLMFLGETFVKNARNNANFKDRTGNLRASFGYLILEDGKRVGAWFKGGVGGQNAERVARQVGRQFPTGLVLVVVAGMEYAAAVESKNYDVLTSSSITAETELKKAIAVLQEKIGRMK